MLSSDIFGTAFVADKCLSNPILRLKSDSRMKLNSPKRKPRTLNKSKSEVILRIKFMAKRTQAKRRDVYVGRGGANALRVEIHDVKCHRHSCTAEMSSNVSRIHSIPKP